MTNLPELLSPLPEAERKRLPAVIRRLMESEDFKILFRHMNQAAGGVLSQCFLQSDGMDPVKASNLDGAKEHVREILNIYISTFGHTEPKPTEQDTTTPKT